MVASIEVTTSPDLRSARVGLPHCFTTDLAGYFRLVGKGTFEPTMMQVVRITPADIRRIAKELPEDNLVALPVGAIFAKNVCQQRLWVRAAVIGGWHDTPSRLVSIARLMQIRRVYYEARNRTDLVMTKLRVP